MVLAKDKSKHEIKCDMKVIQCQTCKVNFLQKQRMEHNCLDALREKNEELEQQLKDLQKDKNDLKHNIEKCKKAQNEKDYKLKY